MPSAAPFQPSADLETIIALADPVRRNLLITQRYHDLSRGLCETVDPGNANWSTFATWASKTAGETIRDEEVPASLRMLLTDAEKVLDGLSLLNRVITYFDKSADLHVDHLLDPITSTLSDVSKDIAIGNLKVFRELAPIFASFVIEFKDAKNQDPQHIERWIAQLDPGPVDQGGQDLLREAFNHYYQAKFDTDLELRAQRLLAANCQIGLHEQTRLQPQIIAALDAPVRDLVERELLAVAKKLIPGEHHDALAAKMTAPLQSMLDEIELIFRRLTTRYLMNLTLPLGQRLSLGHDLAPEHGTSLFPEPLQRISGPPVLLTLIGRYDRCGDIAGVAEGSAAVDWANIDDRMNFIINLFRSRQQDTLLFGDPFTDDQRVSLSDGILPTGQL